MNKRDIRHCRGIFFILLFGGVLLGALGCQTSETASSSVCQGPECEEDATLGPTPLSEATPFWWRGDAGLR